MTEPGDPARVVIAGAGMAGLEAALAIAAYASERASVEVIDPGQRFRIPATVTGRAFGVGPASTSGSRRWSPGPARRRARGGSSPSTRRATWQCSRAGSW